MIACVGQQIVCGSRVKNQFTSPVIYSVFARIRIEQELKELFQNPIETIECVPINVNDLLHWYAFFLGPKHTPYQNGKYYLLMDFPNSYPIRGPSVRYNTKQCKCFHKNGGMLK